MSGDDEDKIKQELRKGGIQLWRPPYYGVAGCRRGAPRSGAHRLAPSWNPPLRSHGAPILAKPRFGQVALPAQAPGGRGPPDPSGTAGNYCVARAAAGVVGGAGRGNFQ